jgi:hypothetical protein
MSTAATLGLAMLGCGPAMEVQTVASPENDVSQYWKYRILPVPTARPGEALERDDPMLVNSITNRALEKALVVGFRERGYILDERDPDFLVAYYASIQRKLNVTRWDYGYPWWPRWWRGWGRRGHPVAEAVTEYVEGTVIIDVLDVRTRELLWRGRGVSATTSDVEAYMEELRETVKAILAEFPLSRTVVCVAG